MKVAILGGKFDPPHYGHLLIAQQVLESDLKIDQVWLMPAKNHPWKKINASAEQRMEMVKLLTNDKIKVSEIDLYRDGNIYTIDTVKILQQKYHHQFYWIIGSDNIANFHKWKDWKKLQKLITFIVFERNGFPIVNLPDNFIKLKHKNELVSSYSSMMIRNRIKKGLSIKNLVPEKVESYIIKYKLYSVKSLRLK